jgi:hypothetical protein
VCSSVWLPAVRAGRRGAPRPCRGGGRPGVAGWPGGPRVPFFRLGSGGLGRASAVGPSEFGPAGRRAFGLPGNWVPAGGRGGAASGAGRRRPAGLPAGRLGRALVVRPGRGGLSRGAHGLVVLTFLVLGKVPSLANQQVAGRGGVSDVSVVCDSTMVQEVLR